MQQTVQLVFLGLCLGFVAAKPSAKDNSERTQTGFLNGDTMETDWWKTGQNEMISSIAESLRITQQIKQAKNVILFIGDGMGVSTVTAARIYHAQSRKLTGDDVNLAFENFPHLALSKTYNTDAIVGDSAATGTAFNCGYKAKSGTIGVNQNVYRKNCTNNEENHVPSFLTYAMDEGKWAGIVTTTRLTHATPAASYAYAGERNWESDTDLMREVENPEDREKCPDIATQLVHEEKNKRFRVLLGGGRQKFMLQNQTDPEHSDIVGARLDRDLIADWLAYKQQDYPNNPEKYAYVTNQAGFDNADESELDYLFGMFEPGHMRYEMEREDEPSLAEMTSKAIKMLQRSENGFALLVEGGRIDHAHHDTFVGNSLNETVALSDAVQVAADLTDESDTLIVVTADHSHAFAFNGYGYISSDILGLSLDEDDDHNELIPAVMDDGKPYTNMMYLNGPGYDYHRIENDTEVPRRDLTDETNMGTSQYQYDAGLRVSSETHGGEEVAIYARGPMSHLFHGTHEQNYIAHVLMYAACLGPNKDHCEKPMAFPSCIDGASSFSVSPQIVVLFLLIGFIVRSLQN